MPGSMIAIANMDIPAIFAYGGTIAPGNLNGKDIDLVSVFEGIGKWNHGDMTAEEVKELECNACPGPGGCGGMYTANTMATAIEVMGMSLPGSSSHLCTSSLFHSNRTSYGHRRLRLPGRALQTGSVHRPSRVDSPYHPSFHGGRALPPRTWRYLR